MFLDSVREGNRLRWDQHSVPFYEVYYLKCVDPKASWSFWARYTLLLPRRHSEAPTASLWGIFHKKGDKPLAFKRTRPLADIDIFHRDSFISIDDSYLALHQSTGFLEGDISRLSWHLDFEDPTISEHLYPHGFLYTGPFPRTKFLEPRFSTYVTGSIEVDGHRYAFEHLPAHQAHLWGTSYATRWAWGHCNQFDDAPDLVFEGLSAQVPLGPFKSPHLHLFHFLWEGKTYRATGLVKWFVNESTHDLLGWSFEAKAGGYLFHGVIKRDAADIIGVEYEGPSGEKRYCHSTMMAQMDLTISKKKSGLWKAVKKATSQKAAFETVEPVADTRVSFLL